MDYTQGYGVYPSTRGHQPIGEHPARIAAGQTPPLFAINERCEKRFWEFFAATIRNKNTRQAYLTAVYRFADWCEHYSIELEDVEPLNLSAYIEQLTHVYAIGIGRSFLTIWTG